MKSNIVFFILILTTFNLHAEDGHNLWLRAKSTGSVNIVCERRSSTLDIAKQELEKISREATERFSLLHVDIIHRIGRLGIGENILIIVVAAGHREEAYAGSRHIIEAVKAGVPVWKKELTKDGGRWVPGENPHGNPKTR